MDGHQLAYLFNKSGATYIEIPLFRERLQKNTQTLYLLNK